MVGSTAGFWAVHGGHAAMVAVPAAAMAAGLWSTGRRHAGEQARAEALRASLQAGGDWQGITPRRAPTDPLVVAAAVAAAAAGLVHLVVMPDHFGESVLYGLFFLGCAGTQLGWCAAMLRRPDRRLLATGTAGMLAVVLLWAVTRLTAVAPLGREHVGALDLVASAFELIAATAGLLALRRGRPLAPAPLRSWPAAQRSAAVTALALTVVVAAVAPVR